MGVRGALGMIGGIFDAIDGIAFESLAGISQLFNTFFFGVFYGRQALRASGLPGAAWSYLGGIIAKFIGLCLIVAFEFRIALKRMGGFSVRMHG